MILLHQLNFNQNTGDTYSSTVAVPPKNEVQTVHKNQLKAEPKDRKGRRHTDFLRLHSNRRQFSNLLSARKKLDGLPAAYTQVDFSHESLEFRNNNGLVKTHRYSNSANSINNIEAGIPFMEQTINCDGNGLNNGNTNKLFQRNNSKYGNPVNKSHVQMMYKLKSERIKKSIKITDNCLALALIGIFFMILDTELCGQKIFAVHKEHIASYLCRSLILFSTLALLVELVFYHMNEIFLDLLILGPDDWKVVVNYRRIFQFCAEFIACAVCPLPGTGTVSMTFIENHNRFKVDIDTLLGIAMIARVYLIARFMVMHSKLFQDASTRTLAALNRIDVNFSFIVKTKLDEQPVLFLSVVTFTFWISMAYIFMMVERYGKEDQPAHILFLNSLYFIAITFSSIGFGDIVSASFFGKFVSVFVGLSGGILSSILIAVIAHKISLSTAETNVNAFMNDSRLNQDLKITAARVIQQTWLISRCKSRDQINHSQLRSHQRRFLNAIYNFRQIKNKMRIFGESNSTSIQQMSRLMVEMHVNVHKVMSSNDELRTQMECIQRTMRNHLSNFQTANSSVFRHNQGTIPNPNVVNMTTNSTLTVENSSPPTHQRYLGQK
uniref:CaMBD domain-containing protein n=1 Tax=Rhabditophanes sp. KR3021 TaxID=114890 RepID=A0AC35UIK4_9BILA